MQLVHGVHPCEPVDSRERPASPARAFRVASFSTFTPFTATPGMSLPVTGTTMEKLKALAALAFWLFVLGYVIWGCLTGKSDWKDKQ